MKIDVLSHPRSHYIVALRAFAGWTIDLRSRSPINSYSLPCHSKSTRARYLSHREGCFFLQDLDTSEIYCHDLATGSVRWRCRGSPNLYLIRDASTNGNVFVVNGHARQIVREERNAVSGNLVATQHWKHCVGGCTGLLFQLSSRAPAIHFADDISSSTVKPFVSLERVLWFARSHETGVVSLVNGQCVVFDSNGPRRVVSGLWLHNVVFSQALGTFVAFGSREAIQFHSPLCFDGDSGSVTDDAGVLREHSTGSFGVYCNEGMHVILNGEELWDRALGQRFDLSALISA